MGNLEALPVNPDFLAQLRGSVIVQKLDGLARYGGTTLPDGRYAVSRLALSQPEIEAREYLTSEMVAAGMEVVETPLGLIGRYKGQEPSLAPVAMMSHFDSVPDGGKFDGTVGVLSAIEIVRIIHDNGIVLRRPLVVIALTGEESSRFNMALFGSRGLFHGLTEKDLGAQREGDVSLAEAIVRAYGQEGLAMVRRPYLGRRDLHAVVELHVSQDGQMEASGTNLAIIHAIAAPVRYRVTVGTPLQEQEAVYTNFRALRIRFPGQAGHSGATPMGREYRSDGLVSAASTLTMLQILQKDLMVDRHELVISVGKVEIPGQALNKIPGDTSVDIRIEGRTPEAVERAYQLVNDRINTLNQARSGKESWRKPAIVEDSIPQESMKRYPPEAMLNHLKVSGKIIGIVERSARLNTEKKVVGTVGTFNVRDGQVILGVDIRGIEKESRDDTARQVMKLAAALSEKYHVPVAHEELPGSGDPVTMDASLVARAQEVMRDNGIGPFEVMFSPAGHDTQNAVRAGIPGVMFFIPSRKGGISHTPDEYSTPEDLQIGARALAAFVIDLADTS